MSSCVLAQPASDLRIRRLAGGFRSTWMRYAFRTPAAAAAEAAAAARATAGTHLPTLARRLARRVAQRPGAN